MSNKIKVEQFIEKFCYGEHTTVALLLRNLLAVAGAAHNIGLRALNVVNHPGALGDEGRDEIAGRLRLLYDASKAFEKGEPFLELPTMHRVESSNISAVGFDGELLFVEFRNGSIYDYAGVHRDIFAHFLVAESAGKFFNESIKGADYACTKRRDRS